MTTGHAEEVGVVEVLDDAGKVVERHHHGGTVEAVNGNEQESDDDDRTS